MIFLLVAEIFWLLMSRQMVLPDKFYSKLRFSCIQLVPSRASSLQLFVRFGRIAFDDLPLCFIASCEIFQNM